MSQVQAIAFYDLKNENALYVAPYTVRLEKICAIQCEDTKDGMKQLRKTSMWPLAHSNERNYCFTGDGLGPLC